LTSFDKELLFCKLVLGEINGDEDVVLLFDEEFVIVETLFILFSGEDVEAGELLLTSFDKELLFCKFVLGVVFGIEEFVLSNKEIDS